MALNPQLMRWALNLYPPYLFTRTRVKYIAPDWKEVVVELKKSVLTRNYVGTAFGGSLYAATDPFYMLMLVRNLGIKDYIIWDKGAEIDFVKPGKSHITYRFKLTDEQLQDIRERVEREGRIVPEFWVEGRDEEGHVCVRVKKTVYIRKKQKQGRV